MSDLRCPYFSRAYLVRCDLPEGHEGSCSSCGDGFRGGWRPNQETLERCARLDEELEPVEPKERP